MDTATLLHLAQAAEGASRFPRSSFHGVVHWRGVVDQGLWLAEQLKWDQTHRVFLFAFGAIHDCQRANENHDPEHGKRAADWLMQGEWADQLGIANGCDRLVDALIRHDLGQTTEDELIGAAWDADRSLLARVGIRPSFRFFSTARGTTFTAMVARGGDIAGSPDTWETLAARALA